MRYWFAGGPADYTITVGAAVTVGGSSGFEAVVIGGQPVTFWSAELGGTQYLDLLDDGGNPATTILSADGTGSRGVGQIPPLQGPDNIVEMWASAAAGPRVRLTAVVGGAVLAVTAQAANTAAGLASHVAGPNPHATRLDDLTDLNATGPTDGQLLSYDAAANVWRPVTVPGLSGVVDLASVQTITGQKSMQDTTGDTTRLILRARPTPVQTANLAEAWSSNARGQGGATQLTFYLNEDGNPRAIASKFDAVAVRIKGQPGQTVHIFEITDTANNPLAWAEPNGSWRAPNLGVMPTWTQDTPTVGTGTYRIYNPTGVALTIRGTIASCGNAVPAGSSLIVQLRVDGVAAYASGNRPTVAIGARSSGVASSLAITTWPAGSYLTVDIDQVGTGGTSLAVQVLAY